MTQLQETYAMLAQRFNLKTNEPLKPYTSFKIGGPADLLALPESQEALKAIIEAASQNQVPFKIFGGGTNILVSDKGIRGLVIVTTKMRSEIKRIREDDQTVIIYADAGNRLSSVCRYAEENQYSGIQFAAGIPGTLGGAVKMNAGTPLGRMQDVIDKLIVLDLEKLDFATVPAEKSKFQYRNLEISDPIVGVYLTLKKDKAGQKQTNTFDRLLKSKKATQPVAAKSAGCFFKNPKDAPPAGKLIEDAGLKGLRVNDAVVSDIHANYIINKGCATFDDVMQLKEMIEKKIYEKYQIKLETEVRVEGEN